MERLTSESGFCESIGCKTCENLDTYGCYEDEVYKKLREYEDAEEQGLLLRLPCKIGDTVYQITRNFISEFRIKSIVQYDNGNIHFDWQCTQGIYIKVSGFHIDDIGKTVFLTKEEAEQALARMEGENG